jgi:hypothetical protein
MWMRGGKFILFSAFIALEKYGMKYLPDIYIDGVSLASLLPLSDFLGGA